MRFIDIVFDGPPSNEGGRFVEVEDQTGSSIKFGTWVECSDSGVTTWRLRIMPEDAASKFGYPQAVPIPCVLICPHCKKQHLDEGIWATRPHRTHQCVDDAFGKGCQKSWTPSAHRTVGVRSTDLAFDVLDTPPR